MFFPLKKPPFLMRRDLLDQRTYTVVWNSFKRNGWDAAIETCQDCGFKKSSAGNIISHTGIMPIKNGPKNYVRRWSGMQIRVALGHLEMEPHLSMKDLLNKCLNYGFPKISGYKKSA
jgi:hypothetical protein